MNHRGNHLPDGLQPPAPPAELRRRVFAAARAAMTRDRAADPWLRLWTSRPLRVVWAVVVVGLIGGNLLVGADSRSALPGSALPAVAAVGRSDELAEIADLGRLTAELPGWEIATAGGTSPNDRKEPS
jgi:hypothetical protein